MSLKKIPAPIKITAIYFFVASLGILLIDYLIEVINWHNNLTAVIQTYKGWLFVLATSTFLFLYIKKLNRIIHTENKALHFTKNKLISEQKLLKSISETSPFGIIVSNDEGRIIFANSFAQKSLGLSKDEIIERTYNDPRWDITYFNGDYFPEEEMPFRKVINSGKSVYDIEHKIVLPDGSNKLVKVNASPIIEDSGKISGVVSIIFDVTANIEAEKKLKESEELLENFFSSSMDGFYISLLDFPIRWDEKSDKEKLINYIFEHERIVKVNQALLKQYNAKIDDMIGKVPNQTFAHNIEDGKRGWYDLYEKGQTRVVTEEKKLDGSIMWVEGTYKLLRDEKFNIRGHFGIQRDITNRINFEQELINARNKAEQSEKLKSEFLAQMSHEIRTPLNIIISSSEFIKNELYENVDNDLKTLFYGIQSSGKRLILTIDQILKMSEIHTSTYDHNPRSFDLVNDIIQNIEIPFRNLAHSKGIEFSIDNYLTESRMVADQDAVEQIIYNLIDNAIKYTLKGSVSIELKNQGKKKIVSVRDTGIGISEEFLNKIFEPFSQEEQGYTRKFEGNGLGLSLVKKYCDLNNAEISVESQKGIGSTFRVFFN